MGVQSRQRPTSQAASPGGVRLITMSISAPRSCTSSTWWVMNTKLNIALGMCEQQRLIGFEVPGGTKMGCFFNPFPFGPYFLLHTHLPNCFPITFPLWVEKQWQEEIKYLLKRNSLGGFPPISCLRFGSPNKAGHKPGLLHNV